MNSLAEAREILAAKGSSFENLDGVVAAFDEAFGRADIKGVEDVFVPVLQYLSAILEPRKPIAGVEPNSSLRPASALSGSTIRWQGPLLRVALRQLIGEHDVKSRLVPVKQFVAMLEIAGRLAGSRFYDLCFGEEGAGHIPEARFISMTTYFAAALLGGTADKPICFPRSAWAKCLKQCGSVSPQRYIEPFLRPDEFIKRDRPRERFRSGNGGVFGIGLMRPREIRVSSAAAFRRCAGTADQ